MGFAPSRAIGQARGFVRRQKHNYRVAITRSSANSFLLNLTAQYDSIYTTALGANTIQLGTISSIGSAVSALISTPVGWLVDRYGIKPFYLLSVGFLAIGALLYAVAPGWQTLIAAGVLLSISMRLGGTGCSVICADSVKNSDRATAQSLCVTLSSVAALLAPLLAAHLVTQFGGLTAEGIRPLYLLRCAGYGLVLLFVALRLREPERTIEAGARVSFIAAFTRLFEGAGPLRRWVFVSALTVLPMAMTSPFLQLFAHEVKGADQYLLGVMTTVTVLSRLVFGIPLGRLADRVGRKRVIYLLTPLWYLSFLLLVLSSGPIVLVISGALQTFYLISSGITSAMTMELVPLDRMGRWSGVLGLFQGLITIPAPVIGGWIWREAGPMYVFLVPLALDLLLKIPLLTTIPETLSSERGDQHRIQVH